METKKIAPPPAKPLTPNDIRPKGPEGAVLEPAPGQKKINPTKPFTLPKK
jgi:hypothetical protein